MENPTISICIATLNAESVIENCLNAVSKQNYPKENIEIIAADGGSTDKTTDILNIYNATVLENPLRTAEAGKAVAVKHAKNDLILILDSDNILPNEHWLTQMVEPFQDKEIQLTEPIKYTWRKEGGFIERYCALIGMNDPICLYIGNYDRWNYLTNKWTEIPHDEEKKDGYLKIKLDKRGIPTIGANGTIFRSEFIKAVNIKDYLFDIDLIANYIKRHGSITIAKVEAGIIHTFCESDVNKFIRKQKRRIIDMNHYRKMGIRTYDWDNGEIKAISGKFPYKFIFYTTFAIPIIFDSIKGYYSKKDFAWFFHYPACLATLLIYVYYSLLLKVTDKSLDRSNWKQ